MHDLLHHSGIQRGSPHAKTALPDRPVLRNHSSFRIDAGRESRFAAGTDIGPQRLALCKRRNTDRLETPQSPQNRAAGSHSKNGNSYTASCADADNDGRIDVFQGEITYKWAGRTSDKCSLLWNECPALSCEWIKFPGPGISTIREIWAPCGEIWI